MKIKSFTKIILVITLLLCYANSNAQLVIKNCFNKSTKHITINIKNEYKKEICIMQSKTARMTFINIYLITDKNKRHSNIKESANHYNDSHFLFFDGKELRIKPDSTYSANIDLKKFINQTRTDIIELEIDGKIIYGTVDKNEQYPAKYIKLELKNEYFDYD